MNIVKTKGSFKIAIMLGTLFLATCTKNPSQDTSTLDAVPKDPINTRIVKIPTPPELQGEHAPTFIPVLQTVNMQVQPNTLIGYRIYCSNTIELNTLLSGIGVNPAVYAGTPPLYEDPDEPSQHVVDLKLKEQPVLRCPSDQGADPAKLVLRKSETHPPIFYLHFKNTPINHMRWDFFEAGCGELISGLGLRIEDAIAGDIISLVAEIEGAEIKDINCPNGTVPLTNAFIEECEEAKKSGYPNAQQEAYLQMLDNLADFQGKTCTDLWNYAKGLTKISLKGWIVESLRPLKYLPRLTSINADDNLIADLSDIKRLRNVRELYLNENPDLKDLGYLKGYRKLKTLEIKQTSVTDLTPLKKLSKLSSIAIDKEKIDPKKCPRDAASAHLARLCDTYNVSSFEKECKKSPAASNGRKRIFEPLKRYFNKTTCKELWNTAKSATSITLEGGEIDDIRGIEELAELVDLNLQNNKISDLLPLSKLGRLKNLNLSTNAITNVAPLAALRSLRSLDLTANLIEDASQLKDMMVFKPGSLHLSENPIQIMPSMKDWCDFSISPAIDKTIFALKQKLGDEICGDDPTAIANVTKLNLDSLNLITLAPVSAFTKLDKLSARWNKVDNIGFLKPLTSLRYIDLSHNSITDVTVFDELRQLRVIKVSSNSIESIAAFKKILPLKKLDVSLNQIKLMAKDIEEGFLSLNWLDLSGNKLSTIDPLTLLPDLTQLYLGKVGLDNMEGLSDMKTLKKLDLSANKLASISFLGDMDSLIALALEDCSIVDVTPLVNLNGLMILDLSKNRISNVQALSVLKGLKFLDLRENGELSGDCPINSEACYL